MIKLLRSMLRIIKTSDVPEETAKRVQVGCDDYVRGIRATKSGKKGDESFEQRTKSVLSSMYRSSVLFIR